MCNLCSECSIHSLQMTTRVMAIIEMFYSGCGIGYYCIGALLVLSAFYGHSDMNHDKNKAAIGIIIGIGLFYFAIYLTYLITSILLMLGANRFDLTKCRIWFISSIIVTVINVMIIVGVNILVGHGRQAAVLGILFVFFPILEVIFNVVCMFVVYAFMEEIKINGPSVRNMNMGVVYSSPTTTATVVYA